MSDICIQERSWVVLCLLLKDKLVLIVLIISEICCFYFVFREEVPE